MIVVIADDITGAAELAGIGLRYNLDVVISDDVEVSAQPDLLVIYTNTRSMQEGEAVQVMEALTKKVKGLNPSLFYKKTDSVLRGHVLAEIKAQMTVMGMEKALLIPVNPSLGRTIKNGQYYVNDQPIHQTGFSIDPEFPVQSSSVKDMLGKEDIPVEVVAKNKALPTTGTAVGEAQSNEDIAEWAKYRTEPILFAGGASFFAALLDTMFARKKEGAEQGIKWSKPLVMVSGTTYQKNAERIQQYGSLVSYMSTAVFSNPVLHKGDLMAWCNKATDILSIHNKVIIAIHQNTKEKGNPAHLGQKMSEVVKLIFEKMEIQELLIEGGSTAYSIIQKLGWTSFTPTGEWQQGIVRMKVDGIEDVHLTIKPGSYAWPDEWNLK